MSQDIDVQIDEEDYRNLSPGDKENFVFTKLKELVEKSREGITKTEIQDATPFGRKTIDKHLEKLVALNEAYVRRVGGTDVYYPNGRLLHSNAEWNIDMDGKTYRLTLLENISGQSLYLQDIEESDYGEEAKGGLIIPRDKFEDFIDWLEEASTEVEKYDE